MSVELDKVDELNVYEHEKDKVIEMLYKYKQL